MLRPADDPGVVSAARQAEGVVGRADEPADLVDGAPRRDVVGLRADDECGHRDCREVELLAERDVAALGEIVVQIQLTKIVGMHAPGHARAVRVPGHQVVETGTLALDVGRERGRPEQVVGAQQLKSRAHLAAVEHALLPHLRLEHRDLRRTDEDAELARLAEIRLRGKERHAGEALVAARGERARPRSRAACRRCSTRSRAPCASGRRR